MAYSYKNLLKPVNTESGLAEFLLIAPVDDFEDDGIKAPTAPFANPGDEVTIKTAHVFKDMDGGFAKFSLAPDKNSYSATPGGDKGFVKLTHTATAFIPGSYAQVHETMKNLLNTPVIVLVKDSNCSANMYYQIGNSCNAAFANPTFETGTSAEGVKGYNVTFESRGGPVMIYDVAGGPQIKE
jgi:hypothetical protein